MKKTRILSLLLLLTAVLALCLIQQPTQAHAATVTASGTCGDNLTWILDDAGTLTISGMGDMSDSPWRTDYADSINTAVIQHGVTSIYSSAFFQCTNLKSISIPDSVTNIGLDAFRFSGLTAIAIPDSVTSIASSAFANCSKLSSISLPNELGAVAYNTFGSCTSLTSVTIPASVTSVGSNAFSNCFRLTDVYYGGSAAQWAVISIGKNNEYLTNATIHYTEAEPEVKELAIQRQPVNQTAVNGETAQFTVEATGVASYAWQYSKNGTTWYATKLTGCTGDTLSVAALVGRNCYLYRCRLTGEDGAVLYTDPATLTVTSCISQQPAGQDCYAGDIAEFTVEAQNVVSYQWQYRKSGGSWCSTKMSGYGTDTLSVNAAIHRNGYQYRCRLTLSDGSVVYTDPATLYVK